MDLNANRKAQASSCFSISSEKSLIAAWVIPVNEAMVLAGEGAALIAAKEA
jgi:acetate kinase